MKFSKSLLNNGYVRERIFENGINKTRKILHYVFGDIYGVKEVVSHENFSYKAEFVFSDRPITALYRLDQEDDEIVKELCSAPRCQDTISKILSYIFLPSFVSF